MGVLFNDETRLLMHEDKKYVRKFFFLMENKATIWWSAIFCFSVEEGSYCYDNEYLNQLKH